MNMLQANSFSVGSFVIKYFVLPSFLADNKKKMTSEIANYFTDQTIFITGGTGFIGKILIEKLLRSCQKVKKIHVLFRPKKGKTIDERFQQFFDNPCFDRLKTERSDFRQQLSLISGDCDKPGLGLSPEDRELLQRDVTIVIHAAANVKFDQDLRTAANILKCTQEMLKLSKEMPNLRVFNYISTAYSNCPNEYIEEKVYEPPMRAEQLYSLLDSLDDDTMERITPILIGKWPNTYTFIKSIAEDLVKREGKNATIVRPAIVTGTADEPLPGWLDNFYGLGGVLLTVSLGVTQSIHALKNGIGNIVPVDYVINFILASTWDSDVNGGEGDSLRIYNYTGSDTNPITWNILMKNMMSSKCFRNLPTERMLMHPNPVINEVYMFYKIYQFIFQYLPAYLADFVLKCTGKPQIAVANMTRVLSQMDPISYFMVRSWQFESVRADRLWTKMGENDRKLFNFNMDNLDWEQTCYDLLAGVRVYLLKDPLTPESVRKGHEKYYKLKIFRYVFLALLWLIAASLLYYVYKILNHYYRS